MIFSDIVLEVCERLNLTSDEAKSRVAREINRRYGRVTTSIGLSTSRFTQIQTTATVGNRNLTFTGVEKLIAVIDKSSGVDVPLKQITMDEMHITPPRDGQPPRKFSVIRMHPTSVDIYLDGNPTTPYILYADGEITVSTLAGAQTPDFPESFHDLLVYGAMADEYRKMEKLELAEACEKDFEMRVSDLRMFIAKSAYLDLYQGRYTGHNFRWTRDAQINWDS